ncbi:MAG: hypothetical protein QGG39_01915 [Candidatus Poribacteria bacterium]|nr:hypothetical protein [Candidatus Poribacteria bacterium]
MGQSKHQSQMQTYRDYLRQSAVPKQIIDVFLDPDQPSWAQFDPELGYVLANSLPRDGIDGSATISTVQKNGARTNHLYTDHPCRINTYGNSFTQCHQVSDSETWQSYLSAHLGEPVQNFGMGGYGTYQAYRRMVRTETTEDSAEYVILYVWGDDHLRNAMRCRYAVIYPWWDHQGGLAFHNNFWTHLEIDLQTGQLREQENQLPTAKSLYRMTDADFMVEALQDDLMLQLCVATDVDPRSLQLERLNRLADIFGLPALNPNQPGQLVETAQQLKYAYGFAATKYVIDQAFSFCQRNKKKLMFLLLCPRVTRQLLEGKPRYDQEIVDYLDSLKLRYFDANLAHYRDFTDFSLSINDYMNRYYIGHYSPAGNHFFAYALKDMLIEWLEPKPISYSDPATQQINFKGYLPEF